MADNRAIDGTIEVRLRELSQLFNSLDPSPFHDRDLDKNAEDYIVGWARELPAQAPLHIVVHLPPDEARKAEEINFSEALSNYFSGRAEKEESDIKELFRTGWRYLSIGTPILAICLATSQLVRANFESGPIVRVIEESLILVGWVANWKPIETFLYDWWPLKRRRDLYRRLASADMHVVAH